MTTEALAALSRIEPGGLLAPAFKPLPMPSAGVGFSLHDVARFEAAMSPGAVTSVGFGGTVMPVNTNSAMSFVNSEQVRAFFSPLDRITGSTERIMANSERITADPDMGPGEMIKMMAGVQQFMLECQLTSSVANRTSDGIQELFRQQS
jgi:hypothetical protein